VGDRWYEWIRGAPQVEVKRPRQSLSHSNVLSPALRTDEGSYAILVRLTVKALARLRSHNLLTQRVQLHVKGMEKSWEIERRIPATQSTPAVLKVINELWERRDFARPLRVGVNLVDLVAPSEHTPSLFEDDFLNPADDTVDQLNARFGRHKVFLASIAHTKERAQERIAFQKTELFQEGGTQEPWVNTRNAERMAEGEEAGSSNLAPQ
jgi:DNA polymerase-4